MSLSEILTWIVIGAIAGWLGSLIMKGGSSGLLRNIIIGIIGAILGGWLLGLLGIAFGGIFGTIATATIGAVVLIFITRLIAK
jgi:uncharacterized membrane protein YeaQ/YmgE (transglycosylase-associated protein family)